MTTSPRSAASRAGNSAVLETGARLGFAAGGLLHLLIGWVVLQLALGSGSGPQADQQGAFETLAGSPLGSALLWLTLVGFGLLALWQVTEAVARSQTGDRVKAAGKAVVYAALAWSAFGVVQGGGSGGSGGGSGAGGAAGSTTAGLLGSTGGRLLVGAAGLAVVGIAVYHVWKGWTSAFLADLRGHPGLWVERAGRVGYVAKGLALALVGGFLVAAAAGVGGTQPQGLDGALRALADVPFGTALLVLAALGFAAYGVYSFARARHARV